MRRLSGGDRRGSTDAHESTEASGWKEQHSAAAEQLRLLLEDARQRLRPASTDAVETAEEIKEATVGWLGRQLAELIGKQAEGAKRLCKAQMHAQAAVYEMKLERQRNASQRTLQEKSVELQSGFNRKFEEAVKEIRGAGGSEILELHQKLEEAEEERHVLKVKADGLEEALTMAQARVRAGEAARVKLEEELSDERRRAEELLKEMEEARSAISAEMRKLLDASDATSAEATTSAAVGAHGGSGFGKVLAAGVSKGGSSRSPKGKKQQQGAPPRLRTQVSSLVERYETLLADEERRRRALAEAMAEARTSLRSGCTALGMEARGWELEEEEEEEEEEELREEQHSVQVAEQIPRLLKHAKETDDLRLAAEAERDELRETADALEAERDGLLERVGALECEVETVTRRAKAAEREVEALSGRLEEAKTAEKKLKTELGAAQEAAQEASIKLQAHQAKKQDASDAKRANDSDSKNMLPEAEVMVQMALLRMELARIERTAQQLGTENEARGAELVRLREAISTEYEKLKAEDNEMGTAGRIGAAQLHPAPAPGARRPGPRLYGANLAIQTNLEALMASFRDRLQSRRGVAESASERMIREERDWLLGESERLRQAVLEHAADSRSLAARLEESRSSDASARSALTRAEEMVDGVSRSLERGASDLGVQTLRTGSTHGWGRLGADDDDDSIGLAARMREQVSSIVGHGMGLQQSLRHADSELKRVQDALQDVCMRMQEVNQAADSRHEELQLAPHPQQAAATSAPPAPLVQETSSVSPEEKPTVTPRLAACSQAIPPHAYHHTSTLLVATLACLRSVEAVRLRVSDNTSILGQSNHQKLGAEHHGSPGRADGAAALVQASSHLAPCGHLHSSISPGLARPRLAAPLAAPAPPPVTLAAAALNASPTSMRSRSRIVKGLPAARPRPPALGLRSSASTPLILPGIVGHGGASCGGAPGTPGPWLLDDEGAELMAMRHAGALPPVRSHTTLPMRPPAAAMAVDQPGDQHAIGGGKAASSWLRGGTQSAMPTRSGGPHAGDDGVNRNPSRHTLDEPWDGNLDGKDSLPSHPRSSRLVLFDTQV